ncbi:TIGR03016 family PEP-CTERM system-associated outer membrane protein [Marichromatium gracile]|uniref:Exosortase n=1 Tax=Marichromatium gracile TaxID=1048 RepID=A0ABR5VCR1_MARGR|nr:TIGR03016 family PEP-CTERM system-associated outer membrane protein [Marichromatium gracile]KXX63354.1 exosortase [Marichromatium gracile]
MLKPARHRYLVPLCLCASAPLVWGAAWGADWRLSRQLSVNGVYTDNLSLSEEDQGSDFYVELTPGFVVSGKGGRAELDLAYSLQYLNYLSSDSGDRANHRLQGNGRVELLRERLFVDAKTTARQELIDPLGPTSGDATNLSDNLQTSYTYEISPSYYERFGRRAELTARFSNNGVFYSDEGSDSIGYDGSIELRSGPAFGTTNWALLISSEQIDYQDDEVPSNTYSDASFLLGNQLSRRWRLDGTLLYEDNDYTSRDGTSGAGWELSTTWTPTPRTSLRVGVGHRYFGMTPVLDFSHRSKRSMWRASYVRDVSSARGDRLDSEVFAFEDVFGDPTVPEVTAPFEVGDDTAAPTTGTYISNTFETSYTLQTRRSTLGASLGYVLREYEATAEDQSTMRARLFWSRQLSGLTRSNLTLGWSRSELDQTSVTDGSDERDEYTLDAGLSRRVGTNTRVALQYRLSSSDDITENRVTLGLVTSWSD